MKSTDLVGDIRHFIALYKRAPRIYIGKETLHQILEFVTENKLEEITELFGCETHVLEAFDFGFYLK